MAKYICIKTTKTHLFTYKILLKLDKISLRADKRLKNVNARNSMLLYVVKCNVL